MTIDIYKNNGQYVICNRADDDECLYDIMIQKLT